MTVDQQTGGCLCGAVRYRTTMSPVRVLACHCTTCKQRTGAAFGIGVYFNEGEIEFTAGKTDSYQFHSDESGRWIKNYFCTQCGTTVSWKTEMRPGLQAIAGGSYDDPSWFSIEAHIWTQSACNGISFPEEVDVHEQALA